MVGEGGGVFPVTGVAVGVGRLVAVGLGVGRGLSGVLGNGRPVRLEAGSSAPDCASDAWGFETTSTVPPQPIIRIARKPRVQNIRVAIAENGKASYVPITI